ncbi:sensor domain-containing diguanylate cyclase [Stutzerimonas balearica]|uniref:sensor domain-containing diguanylate cyclase n=1 Tax=Stutzerimonas balearica TaxID=74829 RepID=UPI000773D212|nr:sensor domain-containing diguanylate cyclase [Stutzerimonas balearica]OMG65741.1 sensor domain-containing diguanylate cyclase [Stutzerimonas balearica]
MPLTRMFRIDLRRSVVLLTVAATLVTLVIGFYASSQVQRQMLIDNTLEANRVYAAKLADITEQSFAGARQQLGFASAQFSTRFDDDAYLQQELRHLRMQTNRYDTVMVVDAGGIVRGVSPLSRHLKGEQLDNPGSQQALRQRRAAVSEPYMSPRGNLVVLVSQPIFGPDGQYLGYVAGAIHLKQSGPLAALLGEHFYQDGSYIYVVDRTRRLLYHPQPERLGTVVGANPVIDAVLLGESGSQRLINSQGVDMLAGYAQVPSVGWGIVAQRPTEVTLSALEGLMMEVLRETAPMAVLTLLLVGMLASLIARPLWQLAQAASEMDAPETPERIHRIRSWYFEAAQLKRALLLGISLLHQKIGKLNLDAQTDPLTGLRNRRGLTTAVEMLRAEQRHFAVITLDIDHFKRINDTFGHDVGDQVIRQVADLMRSCSRDSDVLCRFGGEEFLVLLPNADCHSAAQVGERLRHCVEQAKIDTVGAVTISLGVAEWPTHGETAEQVFKRADEALYRAKQAGRNRLLVAPSGNAEPPASQ